MTRVLKTCAVLVFALFMATSTQAASFAEGFGSVAALSGSGWVMFNNSNPVGSTGWYQGVPGVFTAYAGPDDSYIAANFNNSKPTDAGADGVIDNWLFTPEMTISDGDWLYFYTRTGPEGSEFNDTLNVLYSTSGASTAFADFTLLGTIGGDLNYPLDWTGYGFQVAGVGSVTGRFAFEYVGTYFSNDYIGIDSLEVVPEPATMLLLGTGLAGLVVRRRRSR